MTVVDEVLVVAAVMAMTLSQLKRRKKRLENFVMGCKIVVIQLVLPK